MSDNLTQGTGTKLYVSATLPTANTETAFEAVTAGSWKEVGWITEIPEFGGSAQVNKFETLAGRVIKFRGAEDAGSISIPYASDTSDEGQAVLRAAKASGAQIAFKIVYPKIDPGSTSGAIDYALGKVFGMTKSANTSGPVRGTAQIEFDDSIVEVEEA